MRGLIVEFKVECRIFNLHDDDNYIQLINILYRVEIFVENNKKRKQTKPKKKTPTKTGVIIINTSTTF